MEPHRRSRGLQPPTDPRLGQPSAPYAAGDRSGLAPPRPRPPVDPRLDHPYPDSNPDGLDAAHSPDAADGYDSAHTSGSLPGIKILPPPPEMTWRVKLLAFLEVAIVAVLLAIALVLDRSPLVVVPVLFLLAVPFEKLFAHRHARPLALTVAITSGIVVLFVLPGLALRPLVGLLPAVLLPVTGFVLFDVATYWAHRWSHEAPLLWPLHAVHHSARAHPLDGALIAPPFIFLVAAGFGPRLAGSLALAQVAVGVVLRSSVAWGWRPLHKAVTTPEFHHWHHTNESDLAYDYNYDNYSIFLPAWDLLFGTYAMPAAATSGAAAGVAAPVTVPADVELRYPSRRLPITAATMVSGYLWTLFGQIKDATDRRRTTYPPPERPPPELEAGPRRPPATFRPPSTAWPPATRRPPSDIGPPAATTWRPPSDLDPPGPADNWPAY